MVTRSPFLTPFFFRTFANLHVSRNTSWYVRTRDSSGESPSQMSAARFLRGPATCRSRQLNDTLVLPPINHSMLAVLKSHFETLSQRLNQVMRSACSAQN